MLLTAAGCAGVGGPKPGAPAHHREHGFANTNPAFERPPFWTRTTFFASRIWASIVSPRTLTLPRVANDGAALRANRGEPTVTWVGHATLLFQFSNLLNHFQPRNPSMNIDSPQTWGVVTDQAVSANGLQARQMEFGLRIRF